MAHPMARQPTQPMATGNPPLSPTSPTDSPKHHRKNALRGDEDFKHHPTVPSKCIVGGDGLHTAMAKKSSEFTIQAHDAEGQRQRAGGDRFIVSIRGASACRARVRDNEDGEYVVNYKPSTSGNYSIAVTLNGVSLPDSPYALEVLTPAPYPPKCRLNGDA